MAARFSRGMIARYGSNVPAFLECSAKDAVQRARDQFQLLLVYVHSEMHEDTPTFVKCVHGGTHIHARALHMHDCLLFPSQGCPLFG